MLPNQWQHVLDQTFFLQFLQMLGPFVYGLKINSGISRKTFLLEAMCIVNTYIYVRVSVDIYASKSMTTCAEPDFFLQFLQMLGPFVYGLKINSGIFRKALLLEAICVLYMYIYIYVCFSLDIYTAESMTNLCRTWLLSFHFYKCWGHMCVDWKSPPAFLAKINKCSNEKQPETT